MAAAAKTQESKPTLQPGRFQPAEQVRNHWCVTAEAGTTFKQMLHPDYWAHEARKLKPYDMIECRADDGTFWGLMIVLEAARNWAKVHPLQYVPLDSKDVSQTRSADMEDYVVEFKGPTLKHVVIRKSDNEILHQCEAKKTDAQQWLVNHLATVNS
jgi:hypothetical protein